MEGNHPIKVSFVRRCHEKDCKPMLLEEVLYAIKSGDHGLKEKITQIRNNYEYERDVAGSGTENAKKAIAPFKAELPGTLFSGTFSERNNGSLVEYSGLLCADLDTLGDKLNTVRESLKDLPYVHAIMLSPSGDGLKVLFNVVPDPARHVDSFRAIQKLLRTVGLEIDEKCKDLARICFFTYDPELWVRTEDNIPIDPLPPEPKAPIIPIANLGDRQRIAIEVLGQAIEFDSETHGFLACPGKHLHTAKDGPRDCQINLDGAPTLYCFHTSCSPVLDGFNKLLRSRIGKAEFVPTPDGEKSVRSIPVKPEKPLVEVFSPSQIIRFEIPDGYQLVGDNHINMASIVVLGGAPDVGKSLCGDALAYSGASGEDWMGLTVHRKFKTLIIQAENGPLRLKNNFLRAGIDTTSLDDWIRITTPPPYGLCFKRDDFRTQLKCIINSFQPEVVEIDPWTAMVYDQDSREYLQAFETLLSILPTGDNRPALFIIAHTRKPQTDERASGRALLKLLAGSYVLGSIPRTAFVLQAASDDVEDNRVVCTCCKNNDGEKGKRTAWRQQNGLFVAEPNFSWSEFDAADKDKRVVITEDMMNELFESGNLDLREAREKLSELSGASKTTVYNALSPKGRFGKRLIFNKKENRVGWIS